MTNNPDTAEAAGSGFTLEVFGNEYLAPGTGEVDAIVTVTSTPGAASTGLPAAATAVVIAVDESGSMRQPIAKMVEAQRATAAALDALPDGASFAVIAGSHVARRVYPVDRPLAVADAATRQAARAEVDRMAPNGGTAIGSWLRLAGELLAGHQGINHVILLTDGKNEHETPEQLQSTLEASAGQFTCDCRGVGTDWVVQELRRVSSALLGSVDIVREPAGLVDDFREMITAAAARSVPDVTLRLWTPRGATIRFVKQVSPSIEDLTGRRVEAGGPLRGDYPTAPWGAESRDYHVSVEVTPGAVGDEMLAARVTLLRTSAAGQEQLGQGLVRALWTEDGSLSARINPEVAHYTDQAELAEAIQDGLDARKRGDVRTATAKLGRAWKLANASGNDGTAKLLSSVVEVVDPATGTVKLRGSVDKADEMTLDTRSTKTVRVGRR
jgi:hypothetical protein